jgi:hypothetical protein
LSSLTIIQTEDFFTIPFAEETRVVVDGRIESDEYPGYFVENETGIAVYWEHNGTVLFVGLVSSGTGWVSIGLGRREVEMDGANIIIGYVNNESGLVLIDEVGVGRKHFPDVERGGRDDLLLGAGKEDDSKTTIEFVFPLDSGDSLDHSFSGNQTYGFFLAFHEMKNDLSSYHTRRSDILDLYVQPSLDPSPKLEPSDITEFGFYYLLIILVVLILVLLLVRHIRKPKVIRYKDLIMKDT